MGLTAMLAAGAVAMAPNASRIDFRGATLGMPIDAWRALPAPPQLFSPASPVCSSDNPPEVWLALPVQLKEAGVVVCAYRGDAAHPYRMGQRAGDGEITSAEYFFFEGRLMQISIVATDTALGFFQSGLSDKYGKPDQVSSGQAINGMGGATPQMTMNWARHGDSIMLQSPNIRVDRISVEYLDDAANAALIKAKAQARPLDNQL